MNEGLRGGVFFWFGGGGLRNDEVSNRVMGDVLRCVQVQTERGRKKENAKR